ncbi:MAG: hypothetical protein RLO52_28505 [Sandaracinaceae bacterium]
MEVDDSRARSAARRASAALPWIAWVGLSAVLLGPSVLGRPTLGVADNGDYWRVLLPAGLDYAAPRERSLQRFVEPRWALRAPAEEGWLSSASVVAWTARLPSAALGVDLFLWQLTALYLALLGVMLALAQRAEVPDAWLTLGVVVFADPEVALHLASFYAVGPALLAVLGAAWLALARRPLTGWRALTPLCALAIFGAFSQQSQVLLPVAMLPLALRSSSGRGRVARAALLVTVTLLASLHYFAGTGHRFPAINDYHAVFLGPARLSDSPPEALSELGISARFVDHAGVPYFRTDVPPALERELAEVSRADLVGWYLSHPSSALRALDRARRALSDPRPLWLGSHGYTAEGSPSGTWDPPVRPRALRVITLHRAWPWGGLIWLVAMAWLLWRGRREVRLAVGILLSTVGLGIAVAILGDGTFSLRRHLLVAGLAWDLSFALASWQLVLAAGAATRARWGGVWSRRSRSSAS